MLLCSRPWLALQARFHMLLLIAAWPIAAEGAEAWVQSGLCAGAGASPVQHIRMSVRFSRAHASWVEPAGVSAAWLHQLWLPANSGRWRWLSPPSVTSHAAPAVALQVRGSCHATWSLHSRHDDAASLPALVGMVGTSADVNHEGDRTQSPRRVQSAPAVQSQGYTVSYSVLGVKLHAPAGCTSCCRSLRVCCCRGSAIGGEARASAQSEPGPANGAAAGQATSWAGPAGCAAALHSLRLLLVRVWTPA